MTFVLRTPPSGPVVEGTSDGQFLMWNDSLKGWVPQSVAEFARYDYLIRTRQDLVNIVAPVAGEFVLPSGTYVWKDFVTLDDGERLVFDSVDVVMVGSTQANGFAGNYADNEYAAIIRGASVVEFREMTVRGTSGRHGIDCQDGVLSLNFSRIEYSGAGTQPSVRMGGTSSSITRCRIGGLLIEGGAQQSILQSNLTEYGTGGGLEVSGPGAVAIGVAECLIAGTALDGGHPAFVMNSATARMAVANCYLQGLSAAVPIVLIQAGVSLQLNGGVIISTGGATRGIDFDGNMTSGVSINGLAGEALSALVGWSSGDPNQVIVRGCQTRTSVAVGVDWPSANVPSNGLIEEANTFDTATPFANHAATTARVMRRANIGSAGLLSETSVVP